MLAARLGYLTTELSLDAAGIGRLLARWPRAVDCDPKTALAPRLAYFRRLGLGGEDLARLALRAPALLGGPSLRTVIMPRVAALRALLPLPPPDLTRLIARCPTVLLASDGAVAERVGFLTDDPAGPRLTPAQLARAVAAHPPLLEYAVPAVADRVSFLRDAVGLDAASLADVVARAPTLLSLDVARNLAPKWAFLTSRLGGGPKTVARCPVVLTLSLGRRIAPRVAFLEAARAQPGGRAVKLKDPFPVSPYLTWSDVMFAERGVRVPLAEWVAFRDAHVAAAEERDGGKMGAVPVESAPVVATAAA